MSERVRHAMLGVREASSFVPEIGTADTNDKRRSTESHLSGTSKEQERLARLVPRVFGAFCGQKAH